MGGSGAEGRTWLENGQRDPSPGCRIILCHSPASLPLAFRPQKVEASFCHWPQTQAPDVPLKGECARPSPSFEGKALPTVMPPRSKSGSRPGAPDGLTGLGWAARPWGEWPEMRPSVVLPGPVGCRVTLWGPSHSLLRSFRERRSSGGLEGADPSFVQS